MLKIRNGNPMKGKTDALVIPVFEKKSGYKNSETDNIVARALKMSEFSGKASEEMVLYDVPGAGPVRIILAGLGKASGVTEEDLRRMAGRAVKKTIGMKLKSISFVLPELKSLKAGPVAAAKALFEGAYLGNYIFDRFISEKRLKPLTRIELYPEADGAKKISGVMDEIEKICNATFLAREWVSEPSNVKRPEKFIRKLEETYNESSIKFSWLEKEELEKLGCGALLAVARGSSSPPFLAFADYKPEKYRKTVLLVGKGVTFDAGGLDIKTADGMGDMKCDMAGAATVAAAMTAIGETGPDIRVIGVMPVVENMPSGTAFRPGDILETYSGKTVEIGNTDAEGRLILADAIAYAEKRWEPDLIVDLATLTGACVIALGDKIAGVFSFNRKLAGDIVNAGEKTGEPCWAMPMPADYKKLLKSEFADISNMSSTRYGGAITAALFLSEFVKTGNWAHIDIAGPAYRMKPEDYCTPGGTGFGVRLLCEFIKGL